ncbi:cobalt ABC transporter permease [Clostridium chauvoei]|nr:cobalt ABC transporter permease [Clostridium chauvoei]MBX7394833.1 cobalt ABC transporter permease [Clostridium chauvoei]
MKEILINQILPPVLSALAIGVTGIFVAVIKTVGDAAILYIDKQKELAEKNLKLSKYKEELIMAKQVWNIVEEKYRINDTLKETLTSKANEFDKILLEKIPYLTKDQVEELR